MKRWWGEQQELPVVQLNLTIILNVQTHEQLDAALDAEIESCRADLHAELDKHRREDG